MFLTFAQSKQQSMIADLHTMRQDLKTSAIAKKASIKKKKKAVPKMHFRNKEIEALFHTMSPECRKLLE